MEYMYKRFVERDPTIEDFGRELAKFVVIEDEISPDYERQYYWRTLTQHAQFEVTAQIRSIAVEGSVFR